MTCYGIFVACLSVEIGCYSDNFFFLFLIRADMKKTNKTGEKQGDASGISRKCFHTTEGWLRRIKDTTSTGCLLRTNIGYYPSNTSH